MAKNPSPETVNDAVRFIDQLWSGLKPQINETVGWLRESGTTEQLLQATLARELVDQWIDISTLSFRSPAKLQYDEATINRLVRRVGVTDATHSGPEEDLLAKYSVVSAIAHLPKATRLPAKPENAIPVVKVELTEMYTDSQRVVRTLLQAMAEKRVELPPSHLDTVGADLDSQEVAQMGILARRLTLTGRGRWWNEGLGVGAWDLAHLWVNVAVSGFAVAKGEVQFGAGDREKRRFLHPLSFDPDKMITGRESIFGTPSSPDEPRKVGAIENFVDHVKAVLSGKKK